MGQLIPRTSPPRAAGPVAGALLLAVLFLPGHAEAAAARTPLAPNGKPWNVLMIAIDDLNDYPSILADYPGVKTPNLDRFAASTLRFSRAYCPGTSCQPSRTAILSGMAPVRTGVFGNGNRWEKTPALRDIRTLPELFRDSGWYTMTNGKIFHETARTMSGPYERMWDHPGVRGSYAPTPDPNPVRSLGIGGVRGFGVADEAAISDFQIVSESEKLLAQPYEKPFFLAHGIYYPHVPLTVPQRFLDLYPEGELTFPPPGYREDDLDDLPQAASRDPKMREWFEKLKSASLWKPYVRHYLASVSAADELLGRLLAALEKSPHKENTLVVVWADHGWHLGEKSRMAKYTVWDQTAHVTFLIRVPGHTEPGATCERVVSLQDLYPTLVELCGLQDPGHRLSGRSLASLLADPERAWPYPAVTSHSPTTHGLRTERFRYISYGRNQEELYDHEADPHEWTNLASSPEHADLKADLADALQESLESENR